MNLSGKFTIPKFTFGISYFKKNLPCFINMICFKILLNGIISLFKLKLKKTGFLLLRTSKKWANNTSEWNLSSVFSKLLSFQTFLYIVYLSVFNSLEAWKIKFGRLEFIIFKKFTYNIIFTYRLSNFST